MIELALVGVLAAIVAFVGVAIGRRLAGRTVERIVGATPAPAESLVTCGAAVFEVGGHSYFSVDLEPGSSPYLEAAYFSAAATLSYDAHLNSRVRITSIVIAGVGVLSMDTREPDAKTRDFIWSDFYADPVSVRNDWPVIGRKVEGRHLTVFGFNPNASPIDLAIVVSGTALQRHDPMGPRLPRNDAIASLAAIDQRPALESPDKLVASTDH